MILLDMDGVCADFVGAACKLHGKPTSEVDCWDFFEKWGIDEDAFWEPINNAGRDFWANLEPYPWLDELVASVSMMDPSFYICTKPSMQASCLAGKLDWIHKHFGRKFRRYIFTPNKTPLASEGRLLIDDSDTNCEAFEQAGGWSILVPQPWNKNAVDAAKAIDYVQDWLGHYYGATA
jgi:5'(3')-deoxyribonucleotidase